MAINLVDQILQYINENGPVDTFKLSDLWNIEHNKIIAAADSVKGNGEVITIQPYTRKLWLLTEEGRYFSKNGSHEAIVYNLVPKDGIPFQQLKNSIKNKTTSTVGFNSAVELGWITLQKLSDTELKVTRNIDSIKDVLKEHLNTIAKNPSDNTIGDEIKEEYKKRNLIKDIDMKGYLLSMGTGYRDGSDKQEDDLTEEMIANNSWSKIKLKPYDFDSLGTPIPSGYLHPLQKARAEVCQIFLEMGFREMPTNNFVENSFWNFDALFVPQYCSARDDDSSFYIKDPDSTKDFPGQFLDSVKSVHKDGGFGSQGYQYDWKVKEAEKNLLRTHTTAVSARMLYHMGKKGFKPVKYFSVDRVFRNEESDAIHLPEFYQIEGIVADFNLSFGQLLGILKQFYRKFGVKRTVFKPSYNPYTEPSVEVHSFHASLNKWIELGNAGMFRPELLGPMGIPPNGQVFGWGLSLERPTMIKYRINNVRDLIGQVNLKIVQDCPFYRVDVPYSVWI